MLKILQDPQFRIEVDAAIDGPPQIFGAVVRALPESEIAEFDVSSSDGFKLFLRRVIVCLDGLEDDAGQPIAYTDALRETLIDWPHVRNAINRAYWKALFRARAGN